MKKNYISLILLIGGGLVIASCASKQMAFDRNKNPQAYDAYSEANKNMELSVNEGAEDITPKTLKETEETIARARDYIAKGQSLAPQSQFTSLADNALRSSRRLLALTRQAKSVKDLSPEDISWKMEEASKTSVEGNNRLQNDLTKSQKQVSALEDKTENYNELERRDEKNAKFESVRELFNENEAKVYRQGDSIVINLKQIQFPVNKSEIPSSSFGLLKKVQTAIRAFEEPLVMIEGHTDSTGSAATNKALSEKRAEAVKAYLLSNEILSQEKITAMGYGSEKPLASNGSANGRAINRRIDVIIKD